METQEDSLDIAYLKQAALGDFPWPALIDPISLIEHSQSFLNRNRGAGGRTEDGMLGKRQPPIATEMASNPATSELDDTRRTHRSHPFTNGNPPSSPTLTWKTVPEFPERKMSPTGSVAGDTQPISQSAYDHILKEGCLVEESEEFISTNGIEGVESGITQRTFGEDDTGHLDLLLDFDEGNQTHLQEESDRDPANIEGQNLDTGVSSPSLYQPFPESQRFLDRTPATRHDKIQPGYTANTTPSISHNPFSQTSKTPGSIMRLSQVFNATQAASSPSRLPRFDLSSDMPSPNIPIQRRLGAAPELSPIPMSSLDQQSDFAEPEANYVSVKESQAERAKLGSFRGSPCSPVGGDAAVSDDEFGEEDSFLQRRLREQRAENEVRKQFAGITAPPRLRPRTATGRRAGSFSPQLPSERGYEDNTAEHGKGLSHKPSFGSRDDSEIETEQEDEGALASRNSQRLHASGEEDKENVDSGPAHAVTTTAIAHDALSQALELGQSATASQSNAEDSQVPEEPALAEGLSPAHKRCQSNEVGDGTPTPRQAPGQHQPHHDLATAAADEVNTANNGLGGDLGMDKHAATPKTHPPLLDQPDIPSSPPQRNLGRVLSPHDNDKNDISHPNVRHSSLPVARNPIPLTEGIINNKSLRGDNERGNMNKHSPILTHIPATPAQDQIVERNSRRSMLETSPSNQKISSSTPLVRTSATYQSGPFSDAVGGDDELPAQPSLRASGQVKPFNSPTLSKGVFAHRFSTILSSPSGRQRRKMTEIASDESPRAAVSEVPLEDIEFVTADDRAFQSTVLGPSLHSTKIRRGNDNKRIRLSSRTYGRDLTSALSASRTRASTPSNGIIDGSEQTRSAAETRDPAGEAEIPSDTEKTASIWDIKASPQKPSRDPKPASSTAGRRGRPRNTNKLDNKQGHEVEVVIYNSSSSPVPTDRIPSSASFPSDRGSLCIRSDFETERSNDQIVLPNHVLAFFNGRPHGYYPANCIGPAGNPSDSRYKVYFEDSEEPVEVDGLKSLDLKVNDLVKVNLPNVPKVNHIVIGFKDRLVSQGGPDRRIDSLNKISTDIYGYSTVVVQRKLNGVLPKGQLPRSFSVPISSIYLDKSLWSRLGDRPYKFDSHSISPAVVAPAMELSMMSRTQRTSYVAHENSGIFNGMAFAISYSGNEKQGSEVKALLSKNGARILESGFDELFDSSSWSLSTAAPSRSSLLQQEDEVQSLKLTAKASQIGFACLITDQHSRRAKYMQALALNLPCLSGHWVHDCVAKQQIIDWDPYLLAAGTSEFLGNAVKSRILTLYSATNARIADVVTERPKPLAGQSILFVTGRGEVTQQRKAYAFLTTALCPETVHPVQTLQAAVDTLGRDLVNADKSDSQNTKLWDWIYVGEESAATTARKMLLKVSESWNQPPSRKRGRPGKAVEQSVSVNNQGTSSMVINGHTIRILDNEFLCQILILGKVFER